MLLNYIFAVTLVLAVTSSHASILSRIIGGYRVKIENFPFTVFLRVGNYKCAGTILTPSVIVTAAHCVSRSEEGFILAGADDISKYGVRVNVAGRIIHPLYNKRPYDFDIALLKLEHPLVYSTRIGNVKLPKYSRNIEVNNGTALGWGQTYNINENEDYLRAVDLSVQRVCKFVAGVKIQESMFCAGHPTKDTCKGDSGGPFVNNGVLYGIVSFGTTTCASGQPGVFVKVPYVVNWIKKNLNNF
ncbi:hypothetical protein WA026_011461 [Henosepilachna vigintioctopunctata]|uniref:Peptidase S1 domain-containing protein n=1 Tax=Henosepilachna vigintioctopunctata TaxID=420089 RepID=A0AAW1TLP6_9CUCU